MADNRPIGVFDSGLGGLTVVKEIKKIMPNESIVYFGDTGRVPYGTKSREIITRYAREDEKFLLSHDVKMIIAACGTVSSVAYMTAKELPVVFFEMITTAAKTAVSVSKSGRIGIIGTPATINSQAHAKVILKERPDAFIVAKACPLFVPLVEEGWISDNDEITYKTAMRYLEPIKQADVDTLIMGCTHYPALSKVISSVLGNQVTLINPGESLAKDVKQYLDKNNAFNTGEAKHTYFVSDRAESFSKTASILLGEDIGEFVEQVDI